MAETVTDVVTGSLRTTLAWTRTDTQQLGAVTNKKTQSGTYTIADGNTSGQADLVFTDTRTIAANTVEELDLLNLTQSTLGVAVPFTFRQLNLVRIVNKETAAGKKLLVGVDPGRPTSVYAFEVGPGCEICSANTTDSWVVTNTNSTLRLSNPNNSTLTYELYLFGNSSAVGGSGL
jgi:hypothetical protein